LLLSATPSSWRPQLSIDISCPQGAQQQRMPLTRAAAVDRWDRRTPDR